VSRHMVRESLGLKPDSKIVELFKGLVGKKGQSQNEVFENIVNDAVQGKSTEIVSAQLQESQNQLQQKEKELDELRKKTGIEKQEYERIYLKVTPEQKIQLTSIAHKLEIPRCDLMTKFFLKQKDLKQELDITLQLSNSIK